MTPSAEQTPRVSSDAAQFDKPRDLTVTLFWLLIGLTLLPIWSAHYFPSQDGPAHVYNALILRDWHRPQGGIFRHYFELNADPEPNLLGHWIMAGLMFVLPGWVVEKLLISVYIVALPLSTRYAVRGVSRESSFIAFLSFPLVYSLALHKGLYNFCLSLPLFFYFVGYWLRRDGRFDARGMAILLALSLLLYFAHVVSLLEAYVTGGILALALSGLDEMRRRRGVPAIPPLRRLILSRAVFPLLALAPTLCLVVYFFRRQHGAEETGVQDPVHMLRELLNLSTLISYRMSERHCSRCIMLLFAVLTLFGLWRICIQKVRTRNDVLLFPLAASLALYFLTPNSAAGGGLISPRLMLYCYFLLILWLACTPYPIWAQRAVQGAAALLCVWMLATYAVRYHQFNVYLRDFAECAPFIEPNSTVLPICLSDRGYGPSGAELSIRHGARLFLHAFDNVAVKRNLVDLSNYEATQGYFPTLFRPDVTPEGRIGEFGQGLLDYPRLTGDRGRIDYVLIWDVREKDDAQKLGEVTQALDRAYDLIHTSPRHFLRLYRLKS